MHSSQSAFARDVRFSRAEAYGLNFLVPAHDTIIGKALREHGEFARPEVDLIMAYLEAAGPSAAFIDVGGNLGSICLPIAVRRADAGVVAIEAHRGLSNILAANAINNRLANVEVINAAAGPAPGLARFPKVPVWERGNFGSLSMELGERSPTEAVRMCTLDEIAPPHVGFIKIDVEGFEGEVLKGAGRLIAERRSAWLLEANGSGPSRGADTIGVFLAAGYRAFWFFAPFVTPAAERNPQTATDAITGDFNFLALPPGVANLWNLAEIQSPSEPKPSRMQAFTYLTRYGYGAASSSEESATS